MRPWEETACEREPWDGAQVYAAPWGAGWGATGAGHVCSRVGCVHIRVCWVCGGKGMGRLKTTRHHQCRALLQSALWPPREERPAMGLGSTCPTLRRAGTLSLVAGENLGKTIWSQAAEACQSGHVASGSQRATQGNSGPHRTHVGALGAEGCGALEMPTLPSGASARSQETLQKQPSRNPSPSLEQTLPCQSPTPEGRQESGAQRPGLESHGEWVRRVRPTAASPAPGVGARSVGQPGCKAQASLPGCMLLSKALCL